MATVHQIPHIAALPGLNLGRRHSDSSSAATDASLPPGICITHASAVNGEKQHLQRLVADNLHLTTDKFGRSPLVYAVLGNQPDCVDLLLRAGLAADDVDHAGRTALHCAAQKGFYTCLKLLVQRSSKPDLQDKDGVTACHLATQRGNNRCLPLLLKHLDTQKLDVQDCNKRTPLHWAAAAGCADHVKSLLRAGARQLVPDVEGKTPIHWAASSTGPQAPQAVKLLLEAEPKGANWQDYEGRTALHMAVADGQLKTVAALLAHQRCNIHCLDHQFRSALHWAALLGGADTVALLVERGARVGAMDANGATPLHYAAQSDHVEIVEVLLRQPQTAEVTDLSGRSALAWAAGSGALGVIEAMVARDGVLSAVDKRGETALFTAALCGRTAAAERLLTKGADANAVSFSGATPLHGACMNGHGDVVKLLLVHQANANAADEEGRRPLHAAARFGQSYVVHILLDGGAAVDPADRHGRTPLMHAAYAGYSDVITLLTGYGAELGDRDADGRSALHWAAGEGHLDTVRLLLEQGVYPNHAAALTYHMTPLDCAVIGGHHEVAGCLTEYGGVSIATIEDVASTKIQAAWRGHLMRKQFRGQRDRLMSREAGPGRSRQPHASPARSTRGSNVSERRRPSKHRQTNANQHPHTKPANKKPGSERRRLSHPPADSAIEEIVCSFLEHVVGQAPAPRLRQRTTRDQTSAAIEYADQRLSRAGRRSRPQAAPPSAAAARQTQDGSGGEAAAALTIQRAWRGHTAVRGEDKSGSGKSPSAYSYNMTTPVNKNGKRGVS